MTGAPVSLRLMKQATATPETTASSSTVDDRALTTVVGIEPDDGRLAHPATHGTRRGSTAPRGRAATEAELVGFVCDLLQAPDTAVGSVANGHADAALAVLRGAREARPHVRRPTVVLPDSAHPAWFAAARSLGVVPVVVPVDHDGRVPIGPLAAATKDDTVLVVASAASYTHGTVDPIAWIAAAASAKQVPLHVDASSGGWSLAYAELTGRVRQPWGFAVQGVTSVTVDVGPERGTDADVTLLLHRAPTTHRDTRLGGLGSRGALGGVAAWEPPGALLAEVAETLREVGHERCAELALDALDATAMLAHGLLDATGVTMAAYPDATTISLRTEAICDAFAFADALHLRGWSVQPLLPDSGAPIVRLQVTASMLAHVDVCLVAIAEAAAEAVGRGRAQVDPTLAALLERLDPQAVDPDAAGLLLDAAAVLDAADPGQPDRRSATNLLLHAARPGVREALLGAHLDRVSAPVRRGTPELVEIPSDEDDD